MASIYPSQDRGVRRARNERGFTLIELIVVIVVLGSLAGLVLLNVTGFDEPAKAAACAAEADTIQTANAAYVVRTGADAPDLDTLVDEGYLARAPEHATFSNGVAACP